MINIDDDFSLLTFYEIDFFFESHCEISCKNKKMSSIITNYTRTSK